MLTNALKVSISLWIIFKNILYENDKVIDFVNSFLYF